MLLSAHFESPAQESTRRAIWVGLMWPRELPGRKIKAIGGGVNGGQIWHHKMGVMYMSPIWVLVCMCARACVCADSRRRSPFCFTPLIHPNSSPFPTSRLPSLVVVSDSDATDNEGGRISDCLARGSGDGDWWKGRPDRAVMSGLRRESCRYGDTSWRAVGELDIPVSVFYATSSKPGPVLLAQGKKNFPGHHHDKISTWNPNKVQFDTNCHLSPKVL